MIVLLEILKMKIEIRKHKLNFKFKAGTSRGAMTYKDSWFIKLFDNENPDVFGLGECGPLNGLSKDLNGDLEKEIEHCVNRVTARDDIGPLDVHRVIHQDYPALRFALETAILDLAKGGKRILFNNAFTNSEQPIPINGLVWMGDKDLMLQRVKEKIDAGYSCIKIKIGAINFEDELTLLKYIRDQYSSDQITIRLDANGAFEPEEVFGVLDQLSAYDIHSIEQPIMAGNWKSMRKVCRASPIPIALDEELIGIHQDEVMTQMLDYIKPDFVILKPTLLGGLSDSQKWINLATAKNIGWWFTSALESNIGLNAIAQFAANLPIRMPQGLGTGQLFHNNIDSPLMIKNAALFHDLNSDWDLSLLS